MATTKISQIIIRKGNLADLPVLKPGEFMLAGDEQRLFLGQQPVSGSVDFTNSTTTDAFVTFEVPTGGVLKPLDLDDVSEFSILVTDNTNSSESVIPSANITTNDTVLSFAHGLGRAIDPADTFVLRYNKEVTSYTAERDTRRHATKFTKSQPSGTPESTGIDFLSSVKNDINIEYSLFDSSYMRKGSLNIVINGNSASFIKDKFTGDTQLSDVAFTVSNDGAGKFTLNFDTTVTTQLQFNYTQTSSKFVTS